MNTIGEIGLQANYKLTICSDETLKKVCKETNLSADKAFINYKGKYRNDIKSREWHNLVPLAIRSSIATLISGTTVTPSFKANYIALWSDSTPPTNADIILWAETIRRLIWDRRSIDNIVYLDKNFWSVEVWGNTYNEIWVFIDWTATIDTWFLLSRIWINQTMQALENLTINITITII